ncbi:MAG TPA: hypothetical protein VG267_05350 [Terracidiphilus sp.]|jgi:hypothetical protein|nr:hypothetical protein [Terracidiphilus sp.]
MIPNLAVIRIQGEHGWCPPIPVPLFLIWIFAILLSPLILAALLVLWVVCLGAGYQMWRLLGAFWQIVCALRGTEARVAVEGKHISVRIL